MESNKRKEKTLSDWNGMENQTSARLWVENMVDLKLGKPMIFEEYLPRRQ